MADAKVNTLIVAIQALQLDIVMQEVDAAIRQ
jgi:hypothetical protein